METGITFRLDGDREQFSPGDTLGGVVTWDANVFGDRAELSVLWNTEGKGDQNSGIAYFEEIALDSLGEHRFQVKLPLLPLTYYGQLLKIHWTVRLRVDRRHGTDFLLEIPFVMRTAAPAAVAG